jgi:hypothetical protein
MPKNVIHEQSIANEPSNNKPPVTVCHCDGFWVISCRGKECTLSGKEGTLFASLLKAKHDQTTNHYTTVMTDVYGYRCHDEAKEEDLETRSPRRLRTLVTRVRAEMASCLGPAPSKSGKWIENNKGFHCYLLVRSVEWVLQEQSLGTRRIIREAFHEEDASVDPRLPE